MNNFNLFVQLSGFGHYGVKSVIDFDTYMKLVESPALLAEKEWEFSFIDRSRIPNRIGYENSLMIKQNENDDSKLDMFWASNKLREAMLSHQKLGRLSELIAYDQSKNKEYRASQHEGNSLSLSVDKLDSGWLVKANFGDEIWDIIERSEFQDELRRINEMIQLWWQDQNNDESGAQYVTVFEGIDGPTLQVYHPGTKGLWICGARKSSGEYQLVDHNTDTYVEAFSHVIALCIIRKRCLEIISCSP